MLWQVRALLPDRPGAMAALASRCGTQGANILALDVHPAPDGRVIDELVVHAPSEWTRTDVERLCHASGVDDCVVTPCGAQALQDQPVRYLRAAQVLVRQPQQLETVLCRLLDAAPSRSIDSATLLLDDDAGPRVALEREHPFTATEQARATELRLVAAAAAGSDGPTLTARTPGEAVRRRPAPPAESVTTLAAVTLRAGTIADGRDLVELHDRCSAETLRQRYHSPVRNLSTRLAEAMLEPDDGFSVVVTAPDGALGGFGLVILGEDVAEAALLVEDRWQRQGLGTRLLAALAEEAAGAGVRDLTLLARRGNTSVLATVHRAGLRAHVGTVDGLSRIRVPLGTLTSTPRTPGRPARGRITQPLVALLHHRQELREVYAPADLIDRSVRENV